MSHWQSATGHVTRSSELVIPSLAWRWSVSHSGSVEPDVPEERALGKQHEGHLSCTPVRQPGDRVAVRAIRDKSTRDFCRGRLRPSTVGLEHDSVPEKDHLLAVSEQPESGTFVQAASPSPLRTPENTPSY